MAGRTSKTARASVRAGQGTGAGAITVLGDMKYIIPLDGGRHAYIRNVLTGRTAHVATDSEAFDQEISAMAQAGHASKIRSELLGLVRTHPDHGWDTVEKRLADAGVFEG